MATDRGNVESGLQEGMSYTQNNQGKLTVLLISCAGIAF